MSTNIFSTQLLNMSTSNIKQLKSYVLKTMQANLLPFDEFSKGLVSQNIHLENNNNKLMLFFTQSYKEKQLQVDNLANFILQFLSSLQDVFQEMNFKDKKINDLKSTLIEQTDVIKRLQDDIQQYKDKLNNAEDYIHWMQEQMQYFDLLCMSNPKNNNQSVLSKCRSQKTFTSSEIFLQNDSKLQRKKKLDYDKIKFYIENLKQQKNYLIKEYNALLDQHERKLFECEKHSVLLDQLFEKYKSQSTLQMLTRISSRKNLNSTQQSHQYLQQMNNKHFLSQKKSNGILENQVSICIHENPQIFQSKVLKQTHNRDNLKLQYDESFIESSSLLQSFVSDVYYKHNVKMDVGVNTKKIYNVTTACQTDNQFFYDQGNKKESFLNKSIIHPNKSKLSPKISQESFNTQNSDIKCQISINLKNLSASEVKKIDFSKLISREVLGERNQSHGYTTCHRDKKKGSKHFCQHIYCFLTNKVVTQRIKTYKYARK